MIGCKCSEAQLAHVGCECVEMTISVWPKGYAHETGLKRATMAHGSNYAAEARKLFGTSATVESIRETSPIRRNEKFSAEYIREMSIGG